MGFLKRLPFITVVLVGTSRAWDTTLDSSDLVARVDLRNAGGTEHIVQSRYNKPSATVRTEEEDSTVGKKAYMWRREHDQGYNLLQRSPSASKNLRATVRAVSKPKSKPTAKPSPKLALNTQRKAGKAATKPKALNLARTPKHGIPRPGHKPKVQSTAARHKPKVQSTAARHKPKVHSTATKHKPKAPQASATAKHKSTKASGIHKHKVQNPSARHKPKVHNAAAKHKPKVPKASAPLKHKGSKAFGKHKPKAHKVATKHRNKAHKVPSQKTAKAAPHRKPKPHKVAAEHKVKAQKAVAQPKHQPGKQFAKIRSKATKQHKPKSTKVAARPPRKVAKVTKPNQPQKPKSAGKGPICRRGPGQDCGNQRSASPDRASTSSSEGGVVDLKDVSTVGTALLAGDTSQNKRYGIPLDRISDSTYNYLARVGDLHANTALQGRLGYKGVPGPGAPVNSNPPSDSSSSSQPGSPHVNAQNPSPNNNQASPDTKPNAPVDSSLKPNPGTTAAGGVKVNGGEQGKSFYHSDSEEDLTFYNSGSGSE